MFFIIFIGLLMSYVQFELLIGFLEWFEICGPMQYYGEVQADGSIGIQNCYFRFSSDYIGHVRNDLRFLIQTLFAVPYSVFAATARY